MWFIKCLNKTKATDIKYETGSWNVPKNYVNYFQETLKLLTPRTLRFISIDIRQKQLESDNDVDWLFHRSHNNFICYQDVKSIWILSGKYLSGVCRMIAGARLTGLPDLKLLWVRCPGCSLHPPAASHHTWPPSTRGSGLDTCLGCNTWIT